MPVVGNLSVIEVLRQLTGNLLRLNSVSRCYDSKPCGLGGERNQFPKGSLKGSSSSISASGRRSQLSNSPLPTSQTIFVNIPRLPMHSWANPMTSGIPLRRSLRRKAIDSGWAGLREMRRTIAFRSSPLWQMQLPIICCSRLARVASHRRIEVRCQ